MVFSHDDCGFVSLVVRSDLETISFGRLIFFLKGLFG